MSRGLVYLFSLSLLYHVRGKCTVLSSKEYGDLKIMETTEVSEGCVPGYLFIRVETGQYFCLMEEEGDEIFQCSKDDGQDHRECGISNEDYLLENEFKSDLRIQRVLGGPNLNKNAFPWTVAVFLKQGKDYKNFKIFLFVYL